MVRITFGLFPRRASTWSSALLVSPVAVLGSMAGSRCITCCPWIIRVLAVVDRLKRVTCSRRRRKWGGEGAAVADLRTATAAPGRRKEIHGSRVAQRIYSSVRVMGWFSALMCLTFCGPHHPLCLRTMGMTTLDARNHRQLCRQLGSDFGVAESDAIHAFICWASQADSWPLPTRYETVATDVAGPCVLYAW